MVGHSEQDRYFMAIGAKLQEADQGVSQGLFDLEDLDAYLAQDAQGLFGISVSWEDLRRAGQALWEKASPKLWDVFCNKDTEEHHTLAGLINSGSTNIPAALAVMVAPLLVGMVPAIAMNAVALLIAGLLLKVFFTSAYEAGCDAWKKTLPAQ